jgi:quinol-cytochrome oxidoreductase complex cytochrome b subunit
MFGSALRGTRSTAVALGAAVMIAVGVPLVWVWIASQLAGGERDLTPSLAVFITTGILVSYWIVLLIGSWIRGHWVSEEEERTKQRRMSWNRSFRDEPYQTEKSDPVETVFVATALLAIVAFEVWFFFFAGSPLPNQPLF